MLSCSVVSSQVGFRAVLGGLTASLYHRASIGCGDGTSRQVSSENSVWVTPDCHLFLFTSRTILICLLKDILGLFLTDSSVLRLLGVSLPQSEKRRLPHFRVWQAGEAPGLSYCRGQDIAPSPLSGSSGCRERACRAFHFWRSRKTKYWVVITCHHTLYLPLLLLNACVCSNCTGKHKHNSSNTQIKIQIIKTLTWSSS